MSYGIGNVSNGLRILLDGLGNLSYDLVIVSAGIVDMSKGLKADT